MTPPACTLDGCDKPRRARGMCTAHYRRFMRHGDPTAGKGVPGRVCSVEGCGQGHYCRGLCVLHYNRAWRYKTLPERGPAVVVPRVRQSAPRGEPLRFLRELPATDECIVWPYCDLNGTYGMVTYEGRQQVASRVALMLNGGPPPPDKPMALHSCHNKPCVNIRHLRWGTRSENSYDESARRQAVSA